MVHMCLFRRDASVDIQQQSTPILVMLTFLHIHLDLDLRSTFEIDLNIPELAYFDAF